MGKNAYINGLMSQEVVTKKKKENRQGFANIPNCSAGAVIWTGERSSGNAGCENETIGNHTEARVWL